jgi:hypothetical protein
VRNRRDKHKMVRGRKKKKKDLFVDEDILLAKDLHGKQLVSVLELHEVDLALGAHAKQF